MKDWGELSETFEKIHKKAILKELNNESEAQTRFDIIDRVIREILQYVHGQISVEPHTEGVRNGFIDYILLASEYKIIVEAKKIGASFPSPTRRKKLKLTGTILGQGEISEAISQAESYARNIDADIVMVTNGECWCYYPLTTSSRNSIYASLLFPFENFDDAETLYNIFSVNNVENHSLKSITTDNDVILNNKLIDTLNNSDYRLGRNNIADHIMPGIDYALLSDNLLRNSEVLNRCYVSTDSRVKFDTTLQMHLSQYKPNLILPAKKVKRGNSKDDLFKQIDITTNTNSNPVTLLIGSVGSGKSTYLKYFELVKSKELLKEKKAHWIYIDLEEIGIDGNPREFIYNSLNNYLLKDNKENPTDYESLIGPAYAKEIEALSRGPYAMLKKNKEKFEEKIIELIDSDYKKVEPYVNKVYKYLSSKQLCVIVIDNVDLFENEELEKRVFSEATSISKSIKCSTIVSIRDTTFIKHKNNSIFNAYELKKFWINPPSFREVLSKRLIYAQHLLKGKSADVEINNGITIKVDDLSLFFSIVQKSVLNENNGKFLEYLSDRNPRKGLHLIQNFLTSGHIQADKAIRNYIEGEANFTFPYHELFKGSVLGQWKYYKETRAEAINIFESNLGSSSLQLVRLYILQFLHSRSKIGLSEVLLTDIRDVISQIGISIDSIKSIIKTLVNHSLIHSNEEHLEDPSYYITLSGGYYIAFLSNLMVYTESVMLDTNIYDNDKFEELTDLTNQIEYERDILERMKIRKNRMIVFLEYLIIIENNILNNPELEKLKSITQIKEKITKEFDKAISRIEYRNKKSC
ncbi:AAA domain-containing protein [Mesonia algae]|uniref:AAA domain-containing protein n=1 Tax=Mesonia algae TaxID=213248 RepID=A0A2W7HYT9_9FLAO|nr:AAA family ATPase [Mesonia algae]PZW37631.1 AAA domain-containing protein [Mesonia algae]